MRIVENMSAKEEVRDSFVAPDGRLHVLTFDRAGKRSTHAHVARVWSTPFPEGALLELRPHVYVESPPFMFLRAATILSFDQLVAFGDELCGFYSFAASERRGFRKRTVPLSQIDFLKRFLEGARGCPGYKQASKAIPFLVNGSASPMETFDEMTMCLPYRYGGYGLPKAHMNEQVTLSPRAARIANRKTCYLDMGYYNDGLDIEHHGKHDHSSDEEVASDRARVNGLREMGIEVIELTSEQVNDLLAYEYIIERAARILGKRLDKNKMGATKERLSLRRSLRDWNSTYGRVLE